MRVSAYVLLADAAWIEDSVLSYYDLVDHIVASFDEREIGWSGHPIAARHALDRLRAIDRDNKVTVLTGDYVVSGGDLMGGETRQRQEALDAAGRDADYVLQLDPDEILMNPKVFMQRLHDSARLGAPGMEYPARYVWTKVSRHVGLEFASRHALTWMAIPGPLAVRSGTTLRYARQIVGEPVRCTWSRLNTGSLPRIRKRDAVLHLHGLRSTDAMRWKALTSGHANEIDLNRRVSEWERAADAPVRALLTSHLPGRRSLRLAWLPFPASESNGYSGVEGAFGASGAIELGNERP
jgi:hypothetical protein